MATEAYEGMGTITIGGGVNLDQPADKQVAELRELILRLQDDNRNQRAELDRLRVGLKRLINDLHAPAAEAALKTERW